ncbi:MAG TPA: hypothetical protein VGE74_04395, partial [Gemmata sp.]
MSSSDPNRLSIRIEISAPVGGGVSVVDLNNPPPVRGGRFFALPFDPVSPSVLGCQPVTVESGTSLGSISAQVAYAASPPDEVKAIVFPHALSDDYDQPHRSAVAGVPNSDKSVWSWGPGTGNRLLGVDHISTGNGALNALSVWRKNQGGGWVPDGTIAFYGKTGTCGSGSGSGSLVGTVATVGELADTPQLFVVIPDGPNAGQYPATPSGPRTWRVVARSGAYEIGTSDGIVFTLRGSCGAAVSTRATYHPFSAMFPGALV